MNLSWFVSWISLLTVRVPQSAKPIFFIASLSATNLRKDSKNPARVADFQFFTQMFSGQLLFVKLNKGEVVSKTWYSLSTKPRP